ncbi:uncharacterized protein LOC132720287 [Ruditapes philippinarum]|uniref:uncharacterized protein LOC132720287 n=1 Tax=Ruditapes philippinarum TaxID=129788 RepID=UPI00295C306B|nr:uncharacterized protein LOC132720287 [Ruditapes philippinarum]
MAGITSIEYEESTVSSVRSTISTASSGYAIISVPGKQREDVRAVYPAEPPPDYDDPPVQTKDYMLPRYKAGGQSSPRKDYETTIPLLSEDSKRNDYPRAAVDVQSSPVGRQEIRVPLITEKPEQQQQTIVRISSKSQDLNIEIVSNPAGSPTPTDSTFVYSSSVRSDPTKSPAASTAADTSFLYEPSKQEQPKRKCRRLTKREKIIVSVSVVLLLALLILLLNFTVCIGDFTSKCD